MLGDKKNMGEKKNDRNVLDEHWAEQYEKEFGHFFLNEVWI